MSKKPETIAKEVQNANVKGRPPIDKWHPELSGDIDIRITRDGTWMYEGKPLGRESIARLFSTILRREDDGEYYLVTPVEKWRIQVEDTPLLAHTVNVKGEGRDQVVSVITNMGEALDIGPDHPLRVEQYPDTGEPRPVVDVFHGAEARLVTTAYYELTDYVTENPDNPKELGVWSQGNFYTLGHGT